MIYLKTKLQTRFVTCIRAQLLSSLCAEQIQNPQQNDPFRQYITRARQAVNSWLPQIFQSRCWAPVWNQLKRLYKIKIKVNEDEISSLWSLSGFLDKCIFFPTGCAVFTQISQWELAMTQFFVHKSPQLGHVLLTESEGLTQCETLAVLKRRWKK